ncbi:uncharacterized protein LOC122078108 [Macadamia integrifolia]|uniref:uncharacterized protein LOC122078108 n=1 Tax=Macadamia integrifolia TaxID=60698 RepID=UPI001C4E855C|nr:uncharacterized protein LOC122078108 [Macadamia integrifolia]
MKIETIVDHMQKIYGLQFYYTKLYRARKIALEINEGSHSTSYEKLPAYSRLVLQKDVGSIFKLQVDTRNRMSNNPIFKKLFVCFDACKKGFLRGCRPFIGLDGYHLKGRYGGVLLNAISVNGNNGIFPIAHNVVEVECKDSWMWFLDNLRDALLDDSDDMSLTFMSDRQKGLSVVISTIFPYAHQRIYNRHLYQNLKAKHPASISYIRGELVNYCDPFFSIRKYLDTYKEMIHPLLYLVVLKDDAPNERVLPPNLKRLSSRPHKIRKREAGEALPSDFMKRSSSIRCDICKNEGHNRRTCPRAGDAELDGCCDEIC